MSDHETPVPDESDVERAEDAEQPIEASDRWKSFIDLGIRGAEELRAHLGVDENLFVRVAGQAVGDPKGYVLYAALDEVQKTAMHMMQLAELLSGDDVSPSADRMARLVITSIVEQQRARERRLVEVLVNLVLFSDTNEPEYYRHLLMLEELESMLYENDDIEEFHGARSANIDASIAAQAAWIVRVQPNIDFQRAWYLDPKAKPIPAGAVAPKRLRSDHVKLSTVRTRIRRAIPMMTPSEKLAAGITYGEAYGAPSEAVHFAMNAKPYLLRDGLETALMTKLGLLVSAVLVRCHRLLGMPDAKIVALVGHASDRSDGDVAGTLVGRLIQRDIASGDFVVVNGDLAEVLEVRVSTYGHQSFRIQYLAERPLPDVGEDWFPARYVRRLFARSQALAGMDALWRKHALDPALLQRIRESPPNELQDALRESLRKLWPALRLVIDRPHIPEVEGDAK